MVVTTYTDPLCVVPLGDAGNVVFELTYDCDADVWSLSAIFDGAAIGLFGTGTVAGCPGGSDNFIECPGIVEGGTSVLSLGC